MSIQILKDVVERVSSTAWQALFGATVGVSAVPSHPLAGTVAGAALGSLAKAFVGWYYTGSPTLLRSAVTVVEHVLEDPAAKPLIEAVEKVPAVARAEQVAKPVVVAVQEAVQEPVVAVEAPVPPA